MKNRSQRSFLKWPRVIIGLGIVSLAEQRSYRMPRYYFNIADGHKLLDPAGRNFKSDNDAIDMAKVYAIQVSLDTPRVDPKRHIAVLNAARAVIAKIPVYSKPSAVN